MKDTLFTRLKEKFQNKFPNISFETQGDKLIARNVSIPVIPEEVNRMINEATLGFNLRKGQIAWSSKGSSIELVLSLD